MHKRERKIKEFRELDTWLDTHFEYEGVKSVRGAWRGSTLAFSSSFRLEFMFLMLPP